MCVKSCYFVAISALFFTACTNGKNDETFRLLEKGKSLQISLENEGNVNYIRCYDGDSLKGIWPLRYPVYKFLKGDVNNDGTEDLAVGVIKSVRGDTVKRKRLFLFQVRNRAIIPLWLGSRMGKPLEDFTVVKKDTVTVVRTIEIEDNGRFLVAEYEWLGFGLSFNKYLRRDISLADAQSLLAE